MSPNPTLRECDACSGRDGIFRRTLPAFITITKGTHTMPTFAEGFSWNGTDTQNQSNHDSNLTFAELREIAARICDEVPGMKKPPASMPPQIKRLSDVLQDKVSSNPAIIIDKGIHQANQLHFTLTCNYANGGAFHIYVTKGDGEKVYSEPVKDGALTRKFKTVGKVMPHTLYKYKCTGVSFVLRDNDVNDVETWPPTLNRNAYPGRKRGNSFSKARADE